ncbi:hypothetical protein ABDI30_02600 [Paenibacillus cisolokensis]|uniref:hypothetical protein n=1 Tax=Paenibacillus cisolokensis TaxID=1658519 RepID=UPI003D2ADA54
MSRKRIWIVLWGVILTLVVSCGNASDTTKPTSEEPVIPEFNVPLQDVAAVIILGAEGNETEMTNPDDLQTFINFINTAYHAESPGAVTEVGYRNVIIKLKDGTAKTLIFGGYGSYFVVSDTNFSYFLQPGQSVDALRDLIDRIEAKECGEGK